MKESQLKDICVGSCKKDYLFNKEVDRLIEESIAKNGKVEISLINKTGITILGAFNQFMQESKLSTEQTINGKADNIAKKIDRNIAVYINDKEVKIEDVVAD